MKHRLAFAAVAGTLAAAGCGGQTVPPELTVLDHTGSSKAGSTALCAQQLLEYVRGRYVAMDGKRGEIRVDVFDRSTASEPTFPVRVTFEVPAKDQSNPTKTLEDLEGDLDTLDTELDDLRASAGPSYGGTDVATMLTSLGDAARAVGANRIWICSDVADNRLVKPITTAGAHAVLRELRTSGALPDLRGISVIVDTTSLRGRIDLDAAELSALRLFTEELVKRSGGKLIAYGPGAGASAAAATGDNT